jgi:pimeloyl-ACP methyl ester carboxylesterase
MLADRSFAVVNGTRLAYEVAGAGPPVVLLHGLTVDMRMWDDQFAPFAARHRVIRYDLRGFGQSDPPREGEPYTHAADLRALLELLEIERAALVGLSMGGMFATEFALTFPEATSALVLADAALGGYAFGPRFGGTLSALYRVARADGVAAARELWLGDELFAFSQTLPDVAARLRAMVTDYSFWNMLHRDPHSAFEPSASERLREISTPTLVIVGEHDIPDFRAIADVYTAGIRGARQAVVPAAGHMTNLDNPAAFNDLVLAFLAETTQ